MLSTLWLFTAVVALAAQDVGSGTVIYGDLRSVRQCHRAAENRDGSDAAIASCTDAIRSDGISAANRRSCLANRGVLLYLQGDYASARDDFSAALMISGPESAPILVNRGLAHEQIARGDPEGDALAAADYQAALAEDPGQETAQSRLEQLALPFPQRRKLRRVSLASRPQASPHGHLFAKVTI